VNDPAIEARLASLEARVESLEGSRPGRKRLPIVVKAEGICGVDPERDAGSCEDASLYRHQQGCKGTACKRIASEYWAQYRARKRAG
jgi:hypothetical protein